MHDREVSGLVTAVHSLYCQRSRLDDFTTLYAAGAVFADPLVRKRRPSHFRKHNELLHRAA